MISVLQTGPSLTVKIAYEDNNEKTIGFATKLSYQVMNGQKVIQTVDSPFPIEIAQGAAPSYVRGTIQLLMPRGQTLEDLGLVPYRHDAQGYSQAHLSKYFHIRVYDRLNQSLIFSLDHCKVGSYSMDIAAKSIVMASITFEGILASPGNVV